MGYRGLTCAHFGVCTQFYLVLMHSLHSKALFMNLQLFIIPTQSITIRLFQRNCAKQRASFVYKAVFDSVVQGLVLLCHPEWVKTLSL